MPIVVAQEEYSKENKVGNASARWSLLSMPQLVHSFVLRAYLKGD